MDINNPSDLTKSVVAFDTTEQSDKINETAAVTISAMGKLNFSTNLIGGLDSYRYDTGLIAESNRIVYGDPTDEVTYPGVSAAGAEIFIQPPLVRKITMSINVRLSTGVPFSKIVEQVRSDIAAVVNSSKIGQSIPISKIIATVNAIPGVFAVSINSPNYSATSDVIVINPSEKPLILDIVNDITVAKVG